LITGEFVIGLEFIQQLFSGLVPGPFFELKPQVIEIYIEKPLRINIATDNRTSATGHNDCGLLVRIYDAAGDRRPAKPMQIGPIEYQ